MLITPRLRLRRAGGGLGPGDHCEPDPEQDTAEGASEWATAEPEVEECMQWVDWAGLSAAGVV